MKIYEKHKTDKDHVATPRYVVEDIYNLIDIESFKSIWFPFNNYDSEFKTIYESESKALIALQVMKVRFPELRFEVIELEEAK